MVKQLLRTPGRLPPQGTLSVLRLVRPQFSAVGGPRRGGQGLLLLRLERRGDVERERGQGRGVRDTGWCREVAPKSLLLAPCPPSAIMGVSAQPPPHRPSPALCSQTSPGLSHTLALMTPLLCFSPSSILQA